MSAYSPRPEHVNFAIAGVDGEDVAPELEVGGLATEVEVGVPAFGDLFELAGVFEARCRHVAA